MTKTTNSDSADWIVVTISKYGIKIFEIVKSKF